MKARRKNLPPSVSRRKFIASSAAAAAGFTILPGSVISGMGHIPPSDKLNVAGIGVGNKGNHNLRNIAGQNIVALCDVDWHYAGRALKQWPEAKQWTDYRKMLEEQKDIEAVVVGTSDHAHALPAMIAMQLGKHVYVQKPLTHNIWESRELLNASRKYRVATQMGNQSHSDDSFFETAEYIMSGVIGEIREVHTWSNRPIWPQGLNRPENSQKIPDKLDWDLFVGPAQWREYHPTYTPWTWRGWWDYGTGALGDMGCHIFDIVFFSLKLGSPSSVQASSTPVFKDSAPEASKVEYHFPARPDLPDLKLPEVKVTWYDGGLLPPHLEGLPEGTIKESLGSILFVGSKGMLICRKSGGGRRLFPTDKNFSEPKKLFERIPDSPLGGARHEMDWVRACKENPETRKETSTYFEYSSPLTELVLLGNLAVRLQNLSRRLIWNSEKMTFDNIGPEEKIKVMKSRKFVRVPGEKPDYEYEYEELNALESASKWIKPDYRSGWGW